MSQQEVLDRVKIGQSPLTGRVYIGVVGKDGGFKAKSDFTERLVAFAPQLIACHCKDCANLAVGENGTRWCAHWSRKVPLNGYCHLGERRER